MLAGSGSDECGAKILVGPSVGCHRNPPSANDTPIVNRMAVMSVTLRTDMREAARAKTELEAAASATGTGAAAATAARSRAGSSTGMAITGTGTVARSM